MEQDARHSIVTAALAELRSADALRRLRQRDVSLWSTDPAHHAVIANRLGWLDVAAAPPGWLERIRDFVAGVRADGLDEVVLAGMGGSSLAPEVFASVLGDAAGASLRVLDSTHPDTVGRLLDEADWPRTLVVVSSKSGSTEETRDFGLRAEALAPSPAHLAAITDGGSQLEAEARGWRQTFTNPVDIGGRYSALSLFGMVPAGLVGVDVAAVWDRADAMLARHGEDADVADAPGAVLGAFMAGHASDGRDKLTLLAPPALAPLGDWVEQLVAESTGKAGRGIVPVVGEPLGPPQVYGRDRAFVHLRLRGEGVAGVEALSSAGQPVLEIDIGDRLELGAEFVRWEIATALAGVLLGVDPFDEPNVAESKANTNQVLEEVTAGAALPPPEDGDVESLLAQVRPGDYVSIQAYLPADEALTAALQHLRITIRDRLRVATTLGYGPRFLHSTGQLHKGGPDTLVAVQLVDTPTGGPDIPGKPYDFATLVRAQAAGDLRSLRAHDRRVIQVGVTSADDVRALATAIG